MNTVKYINRKGVFLTLSNKYHQRSRMVKIVSCKCLQKTTHRQAVMIGKGELDHIMACLAVKSEKSNPIISWIVCRICVNEPIWPF